ncbi:MAG: hypothetical protein ACE5JU_22475 [Candidatus Binatia bacterium]
MREAGEAQTPTPAPEDVSQIERDKRTRIPNLGRINAEERVKQLITDISIEATKAITVQRRGIQTNPETIAKSRALLETGQMTIQRVLELKPGTVFNAEEKDAARRLEQTAFNKVTELVQRAQAGEQLPKGLIQQSIALAGKISANVQALVSETARAQQAQNIIVAGEEDPRFDSSSIIELAERIKGNVSEETLGRMFLALRSPEKQAKFSRMLTKGTNITLWAYYWSLLSGGRTQIRNIMGNLVMIPLGIVQRSIASRLHPWGNPDAVRAVEGEASEMMFAVFEGFIDAMRLSWKEFTVGGVDIGSRTVEIERARKPPITLADFGKTGPIATFVDIILRGGTGALSAADIFFKDIQRGMELRALALRQSVNEGLTTPTDVGNRMGELIDEPLPSMIKQSKLFADQQTFTEDFQGRFSKAMQEAAKHPLVRLLLIPFMRTTIRLMESPLQQTPILNLMLKKTRQDLVAGGERSQTAQAKMVLGAGMLATFAYLAASGLITGDGPPNKELRDRMRENRWKPRSIFNPTTGEYFSYDFFQPISSLIVSAANMIEAARRLPDQASIVEYFGALSLAYMKGLEVRRFTQGVSLMLDAVKSDNTGASVEFMKRWLSSWIPTISADIRKQFDPIRRETRTIWEAFQDRIPHLSKNLSPERNVILGEVEDYGGAVGPDLFSPVFTSTARNHPVLNEIERLEGANITGLPWSILGPAPTRGLQLEKQRPTAGIEIFPEERDRWFVLMTREVKDGDGNNLAQALQAEINSPEYQGPTETDGRDGSRSLRLKSIYSGFKQLAKARMIRESKRLQDLFRKKQVERAQALTTERIEIAP